MMFDTQLVLLGMSLVITTYVTCGVIPGLDTMLTKEKTDICGSGSSVTCGPMSSQCVAAVMVCDGHTDCDNGMDESKEMCTLPLAKGDVFGAAKFDSDSCLPHESYNITMTVRYIVVNPWFKSRPTVVFEHRFVSVEGDRSERVHLPYLAGTYSYATRTLQFDVSFRHSLSWRCSFAPASDDVMDCLFWPSGNMVDVSDPCAQVVYMKYIV